MVTKQKATKQLDIIHQRICQRLCLRELDNDQQLGLILSKEDFESVRQMILDEYQVYIETIDTVKNIGYILQKKIEV